MSYTLRLAQQFRARLGTLEVVIPIVGAYPDRNITRPNFAALGCAACWGFDIENNAHALLVSAVHSKFRGVLTPRLEIGRD